MVQKRVVIFGAGGHGKEVLAYLFDLARQDKDIQVLGFVDDEKQRGVFAGSALLGNLESLKHLAESSSLPLQYMTAVGTNASRKKVVERIELMGAKNLSPFTLRHPCAMVGPEVQIGEGTCLAPATFLTTHIQMGRHCIMNIKSSVSHDCSIGDFVNINPGANICGNVTIGEGCYIGAGATIIDKVTIGPWTVIGAGAVVTQDLPAYVTAVGVPAQVVKRHSEKHAGVI